MRRVMLLLIVAVVFCGVSFAGEEGAVEPWVTEPAELEAVEVTEPAPAAPMPMAPVASCETVCGNCRTIGVIGCEPREKSTGEKIDLPSPGQLVAIPINFAGWLIGTTLDVAQGAGTVLHSGASAVSKTVLGTGKSIGDGILTVTGTAETGIKRLSTGTKTQAAKLGG